MPFVKRSMLAGVFATVLIMLLTAGAAQAALTCGAWNIVTSPSPGSNSNELRGVAAVSTHDVWAVGYSYTSSSGSQTLIEHWNGAQWQIVTSPKSGIQLNAIAAVSAHDVWAVGYSSNGTSLQTLIEHWNGRNWSIVKSPNVGTNDNELFAVAVVSASDIWAVGDVCLSNCIDSVNPTVQGLAEHWDGTQWSVVSTPVGCYYLRGVSVVSTNDVWAVGFCAGGIYEEPQIEHWNGTQWSLVDSPIPSGDTAALVGVTAVAAHDVWAVGNNGYQTLIEHWNGIQWQIVPSPNRTSQANSLGGVTAVSAHNVWTVGSSYGTTFRTLIEHWNGTQWQIVASPNSGSGSDLSAVTRIPTTSKLWAVGSHSSKGRNQTLTEFYC